MESNLIIHDCNNNIKRQYRSLDIEYKNSRKGVIVYKSCTVSTNNTGKTNWPHFQYTILIPTLTEKDI